MKKNFLQILTLCLCIVLLVITIIQGMRLVEYRNWMEYRIDNLEQSVNGQTQRIADQVSRDLEEAGKTVADYTLEPVGIDPENRALLADVSVTLKEWYEETEVTLLVETALEEVPLPMTAAGDGVFTGRLSVPLEGTCELSLYARISAVDGWNGSTWAPGGISPCYFPCRLLAADGPARIITTARYTAISTLHFRARTEKKYLSTILNSGCTETANWFRR